MEAVRIVHLDRAVLHPVKLVSRDRDRLRGGDAVHELQLGHRVRGVNVEAADADHVRVDNREAVDGRSRVDEAARPLDLQAVPRSGREPSGAFAVCCQVERDFDRGGIGRCVLLDRGRAGNVDSGRACATLNADGLPD